MINLARCCAKGGKELTKTQIWYLNELDSQWDCLGDHPGFKEMQDFVVECNDCDSDMMRVWKRMTEDEQTECVNIFETDKWDQPCAEDFVYMPWE